MISDHRGYGDPRTERADIAPSDSDEESDANIFSSDVSVHMLFVIGVRFVVEKIFVEINLVITASREP